MRRGLAALLFACAGSPAPHPTHVVIAPVVEDAGAQAVRIPEDVNEAYRAGMAWWEAGQRDDAIRAFRAVVDKLVWHGKEHINELPIEPLRFGDHVAVGVHGGVLLASSSSGAVERLLPFGESVSLARLGEGLVGVTSGDAFGVLDVRSMAFLARFENASLPTLGESLILIPSTVADKPVIDVWSATSRARLHTIRELAPITSLTLVLVSQGDRYVLAVDTGHVVVLDATTGARVYEFAYQSAGFVQYPGVSDDGRYIAYGTIDFDKTPSVGTTFLYDVQSRKVVGRSHAVGFPSDFAFHGKYLAVGDLRRACLLSVPSLALVACSADVRPQYPVDDDLQNTAVTFVQSGSALAMGTADGAALVAKVPSMTTVWKGRGHVKVAGGNAYIVDDQDTQQIFTIGPGGMPQPKRKIDPLEAERLPELHPHDPADDEAAVRVVKATCHVQDYVFPAVACVR